jgi:tetratricopeptide (TPR) repeat protein
LTDSALRACALALTLALTISVSAASSKASAKVKTKASAVKGDLATTGYWRTFLEQGRKQLASKSLQEAEVSFRQALRSVKREPHSVDDLVLCMQSLADVLHTEDYQEEPWKLYRHSLKQLEREYGKESVKLIPLLLTMGSVTEVEGQYKKAAEFYQRAANLAQSNIGPQSFELANCLHHLGHALSQDGPYRDAEDNYRSSLGIMMAQSVLPSSEPLLELLSDYLDLLHKYTGPAKILASQYEKELLKDQVQELGKTRAVPQSAWQQELERQKQIQAQPNGNGANLNNGRIVIDNNGAVESFSTVAQLLSSLPSTTTTTTTTTSSSSSPADLSNSANKGDQIDYYERMVAIDVKTLGPKHPSVARDLKGLAAVYVEQHRYSEARPLLERALEIYQSVYAPDDLSVQRLKVLLALITEQAKAVGDTASGVDDSDLAVIPLQAQTFEVAQRLNELAFLDYSQGKLEDSRNHYAWALSSIANATGRRSVFVAACLQDYVMVMLSSGRKAEAEKMQMQARSILAEALSAQLLRAYK